MKHEELEKWLQVPTKTLISQIQQHFHPNLLKNLSLVMDLFDLVYKRHGESDSRLARVYTLLSNFAYRIPLHLLREEQILFPLLLEQESGAQVLTQATLRKMQSEHDEDLSMIEELIKLTDHFQAPPHSCKSWKRLYQELDQLITELELHIAIENEILFPRFQEKKGWKIAP